MARSQRAWTRLAVRGGTLAASVAVLLWLAWFLGSGDLDRNDKIASVAGMVISFAGLVLSAAALRVAILQLRQSPAAPVDDIARLDRAAEALATAVTAQWEAEAGLRALSRRPAPLRLRWSTTARPVAAPAEAVAGDTVTGRVVRLRLRGHLDEVAEKYLALPHRRLVVLGEPGAGKTVLVMLLTLALLGRRQPDQPVPVLLPLSSWDPTAEHLHTWMARRLGEDYPALASPARGPTAAQQLITTGRVLPVLDGLDELAGRLRATAISELDRARANRPLVVTCRNQEYEQAVTAGGGVVAAAAVVELEPVTAAEAIAFLRAAAAPVPERWDQVAAHLHAAPDGALAAALSTPLMVALARTIYTTPARDPSELVNLASAGGQPAVERHLLDEFIPAAYINPPPAPATPAPRLRRPLSPDLAHRWLTLLASHLHRHHTRDLAWWQLPRLASQRAMRLVGGLAFGVVFGLSGGLAGGLLWGLAGGLLFGLMGGLFTGALMARDIGPARVTIRGRLGGLIKDLAVGLMAGLMVGLLTVLVMGLVRGLVVGLRLGFIVGVLVWLMVWLTGALWDEDTRLTVGVMGRLQSPVEDAVATTPGSVLRSDRSVAIAVGLAFGFGAWLTVGIVGGFSVAPAAGFRGALAFGLMWLMVGLGTTSWAQFTIARVWLAICGQLPLRLMAFLDDAHHRGVLRQAGAVYQFRHARLQDHLAETGPTSQTGH